ncbi:Haloacid Dehalogenase Superfamily Class (subfamily) IIA [Nakamurella panacisegetis]|uniref:Haloacid Dehalogenase Superfamily Class (Subfamily) IIA n=1 Tax=Nakamurella panacisegetis TaxID=1090615 RepID=A0A1H0PR12_9ACTN|nr:HAD hydrolase-like protein [Nakamurella panacisegetis]SDP07424.1 Haloacid Dehalogenase Superfamily Class (subfamily) IIA [Nakamurella panacisegetis]
MTGSPALADRFDALLLDLDGTVYLGGQVIPEVVESLTAAAARGARPMFVTNNASRHPADVADSLNGMGVAAQAADVLTSPEAAAAMLAETHPAGSKVLIVGAAALSDAVADAGLVPVRLAADAPVAVVQGHSPDTGWRDLAEACIAIRSGVDWVASNTDTTLPTDRGLLPGNGAMVHALMAATGLAPRVAGKPNRPLLDEAVRRAGSTSPLVVGDRLDTDIEAAVLADMPSLMVLTGVSTAADLLAAPPSRRPTFVSFDLRGLLDPDLVAELDPTLPSGWTVDRRDGSLMLSGSGSGDGAQLRALAQLAAAAWKHEMTTVSAVGEPAAAVLTRFGLADAATAD